MTVDLPTAARSFVSAEQTHDRNNLLRTELVMDREKLRLQIAALHWVADQIRLSGEIISGEPGTHWAVGSGTLAEFVESLAVNLDK